MRIIRAAFIGTVCAATMLTGMGAATAAVHAPASHRWISGTEHFQIVGTTLTGTWSRVAVYGLFNASGVDHSLTRHKDIFKFARGSFLVTHKATRSRQHFSKATCSATFFERGVYRLSHGRGRYAGIRGRGHYVLHGLFVSRHTAHGCGHKPIAVQTIVRAHGPATVLR